jgi:hypothetical protein
MHLDGAVNSSTVNLKNSNTIKEFAQILEVLLVLLNPRFYPM